MLFFEEVRKNSYLWGHKETKTKSKIKDNGSKRP